MFANMEQNRIYQNSVSPGLRKNLFATYQEYVSLVNMLDGIISKYRVGSLAMLASKHLSEAEKNPWVVDLSTIDDKTDYENFLNMKKVDRAHTCYVSTNHTSPRYKDEPAGIMSAPDAFGLWVSSQPLPQKVERYVLAYPQEEILKDTRFIVDGKYVFTYTGQFEDKTVQEAFNDELFERKFYAVMESFSHFPDDIDDLTEQRKKQIELDVYASIESAPIENAILDALSLMAEETNKVLKEVVGKRVGSGYLFQAEKENLLPSAAHMQDYQNIRHLIRHQWDTLDAIGKFNDDEVIINASVRRRYLDSYARLCDMPLKDRVQSYIKAADDFRTLIAILEPNFVYRFAQESNSKFLSFIKEQVKENPEQTLFVETGYKDINKKQSLIKNLQRISSNIVVVDKADVADIDKIDDLMNSYRRRRIFIDIFQQLENRVCHQCLLQGKNYTSLIAWDYLKNKGIISPSEAKSWAEYKHLRNDLSHKYMDDDLNHRVIETLPKLSEDVVQLDQRLAELTPTIELIDENIYRAVHRNGLIVDIDFKSKKVLQIKFPTGAVKRPVYGNGYKAQKDNNEPHQAKKRIYTEEYPNGVSITISGSEVVSCRLNNGLFLDYKNKFVQADDGVKIYFDLPDKLFLTSKSGEKIFADQHFEVTKFVSRGRVLPLNRNELVSMYNRRQLFIGKDLRLQRDVWFNLKNEKMETQYKPHSQGVAFHYNDGTRIVISAGMAKLFHHDIELNYQNKQLLAESYNKSDLSSALINQNIHNGR